MTISFNHKSKLSTVGTGSYVFRHFGIGGTAYYELDYIESTGAQCIDTGISGGSSCSYEIKIWPKNTSTNGYQAYFCGAGTSTFPKLQQNNSSASTSNANWYAQSKATGSNVTRYLGTNFSSAQTVRYNGTTVYLDNVDKGTLANTGWGSNNVIVFGDSGTNRGSCRVYYLKMYTNGTLVRDFIPVMRVSDLEAGLVDRLTGTFYTNQGTGSFIPGIKVAGYSQLDYLYGTGSVSNIDTGVTGGTSAKYDTCIKVATVSRAWARYMGGGDLPPYPVVVSNQGSTGAQTVTVGSFLNSKLTNYVSFTASDRFHNLSVDGGKLYWDNSLSTSSAINNGWSTPAFRMFTTNWIAGGGASYQVYYKMWTDGELVRYYIPVRRASDNAIGMYDLVGRQFYANDGNTAFTYGTVTLANTGTNANIIYF